MSLSETEDPIELIRQSGGDPQVLGRIWDRYRERLRRVVRLRLDRRLQGRADPSDVLQEAFLDFQSRAADYAQKPDMPFFLWLRFLTGQRLQLIHRHHLGAQMRDAGREVSLHRGAMPQATSVSLAAQLLGRFTSVTQAVQRAEMQMVLQEADQRPGSDRPGDPGAPALRGALQRRDGPGARDQAVGRQQPTYSCPEASSGRS